MPDEDRKFIVNLQPIGRRVALSAGQTLLEAAQSAGVELQAVCGGSGTCGSCKLRLATGRLSDPTTEEVNQLTEERIRGGQRLACQACPLSDVTVDIPPESLTSTQRVQIEGGAMRMEVDRAAPLRVSPKDKPTLGIAVDLGTTKIAGYLVDLESGETIARRGLMNPQIAFGEDVISRISYASRSPECSGRLQHKVVEVLNKLLVELCQEAGASEEHIVDAVIAGNTAMHHLFAGLPVEQLGRAPFLPASTQPLSLAPADLGLSLGADSQIYTPPNIAGYVGGDHVAMLLGISIGEGEQPTLAIDIGTNTEITLKAKNRLLTCSCASGPAFEGAHIQHGMRAAPGAIERVLFHKGVMQCYTIDRRPAAGICGSGILDAIAALLDAGILDERGNFRLGAPGVRRKDGNYEFVLVSGNAAANNTEIVLTRGDISEIQFAKAAIRAGIEVLLEVGEVEADSLKQLVIAGAFGSYLDLRSAVRIGLLPDVAMDRMRQVGNAAGLGARQMLASAAKRREGEELARRDEYIELTNHPRFHDNFVKALLF